MISLVIILILLWQLEEYRTEIRRVEQKRAEEMKAMLVKYEKLTEKYVKEVNKLW